MGIDFNIIKVNIESKKYQLIGSGSGRYVFDLDNGYVVKMAKNKKGFVQNKAEHQISVADHSKIFAKIVAVSEDYQYLIMERAQSVVSMAQIWDFYHVRNNRELFRLEDIRNVIRKNNLLTPDLRRRNSWGMIKGKPVIIDFGFTREVSRYYTLF